MKQRRRSLGQRAAAVALLTVAAGGAAIAANRDFWRFETAEDFLPGESEGVSVGPDGRLRLAPVLETLHEFEQPFVWSVAGAGAEGLVFGGGPEGAVVRIAGEAVETLADTGEAGVQAVAYGPDGAVYFATSPQGSVQRILPGGERRVLHQPEARYLWALAPEPGGSVLAATGMPASVLRIQPSGEAETVFSTSEDNVTALLRAPDGAIYVGTEPSGIVFRIHPESGAMALYDSPFAEIRALAVNSAGEVFAAAVADSGAAHPPEAGAAATLPAGPQSTAGVATSTAFRIAASGLPAGPSSAASSARGAGALYRIAPSGAAQAIWESDSDRPLSLALLRDERLLLGTGDRGRVYRISRDGDVTLLLRVDSEQVTAAAVAGGATLLGASNPGRVLRLSASPRTEGRYESRVLDAGGAANFGRISWDVRTAPGAATVVETRTGNSQEPDETWSAWMAAAPDSAIRSPAARFLQWRAILRSDGAASPELVSLEAAYLPVNLAPRVTRITLHRPGLAFEELLNTSLPRLQGMSERPETTEAARQGQPGSALPVGSGRQLYLQGVRTATFDAEDPNDDRLRYRVFYRAQGEVVWQPLRAGLSETIVAWDTSTMPDGRYELRVEADDSPDNPPGEAQSGDRVSRPFTVDNTPPVVTDLTVSAAGAIRFQVLDSGSPIRRASVSVDGGPSRLVRPLDGMADSPSESYDAQLPDFPSSAGAVVVKVEDDMGNAVTAEARVEN